MEWFYIIAIGLLVISLIVSLSIVGVKVNKSNGEPVTPDVCPDYWYNAYYDITGDPVEDKKQMNLASSYGDELTRTSKCYNVKKLGNGMDLKVYVENKNGQKLVVLHGMELPQNLQHVNKISLNTMI